MGLFSFLRFTNTTYNVRNNASPLERDHRDFYGGCLQAKVARIAQSEQFLIDPKVRFLANLIRTAHYALLTVPIWRKTNCLYVRKINLRTLNCIRHILRAK